MAFKGTKITLGILSSSISPYRQYSTNMSWGILYLTLKASITATVLTKWANPINGKEREWRKKKGEGYKSYKERGAFSRKRTLSGRRRLKTWETLE